MARTATVGSSWGTTAAQKGIAVSPKTQGGVAFCAFCLHLTPRALASARFQVTAMAKMVTSMTLDIAKIISNLTLLLSPETPDDDNGHHCILATLATVSTKLDRGGSGLLAIAGTPRAVTFRRRLLPLACLALMDHPTQAQLKVPRLSSLSSVLFSLPCL